VSSTSAGPKWYAQRASWAFILRAYLPRLALLNLVWEIAQLPLYTIWQEAPARYIAFAVAHCTAGDVMIGTAALILALVLNRASERAAWPARRIAVLATALAVGYTLLSEILNLALGSWAYSPWMPLLPWVGGSGAARAVAHDPGRGAVVGETLSRLRNVPARSRCRPATVGFAQPTGYAGMEQCFMNSPLRPAPTYARGSWRAWSSGRGRRWIARRIGAVLNLFLTLESAPWFRL
jgi:hypothetical protein